MASSSPFPSLMLKLPIREASVAWHPKNGYFKSKKSEKSPETFRAYLGCHNSLYTFAMPRFKAIKLLDFLTSKHDKRSTFRNRRIVVWQLAFQARNVFETFEKQALWLEPLKSAQNTRTLARLVTRVNLYREVIDFECLELNFFQSPTYNLVYYDVTLW